MKLSRNISAEDNMEETIYKFEIAMSLMAPGIINTNAIEENVLYDDKAVVRYGLLRPHTIEEIIDKLEDVDRMVMLYYFIQCQDSEIGRSCSFYSDNKRGPMYRLDFYTERDGMCHDITAIFFTSLEYMYQDIIREHGRIQLHGKLEYLRPERKVIGDFM